jgi:dCTP deaminase
MILSAQTIRAQGIFAPFAERSKARGMTYGLGPAGYDVRVAEEITLWPGSFKLASTVEQFHMPTSVLGVVHDKSTLARRGLAIQNTVIEPGWRGYLTLELSNHQPWWKPWRVIRLRPGTPIAQIILHLLDQPTQQPYAGRYQDQPPGPQQPTQTSDGKPF